MWPPEKWGIVYFHYLINFRSEPNMSMSDKSDAIDHRVDFLHGYLLTLVDISAYQPIVWIPCLLLLFG